jgi:hypothetical protein
VTNAAVMCESLPVSPKAPTLGEDPAVIKIILAHLDKKGVIAVDSLLPDCRASPYPSMDLLT